jgi:hypothetical protein
MNAAQSLEKARAAYAAKMRATVIDRFWAKVVRKGPDECWEWSAYRQRLGYGQVNWNGKAALAHRVALSLTDGLWESPLHVCHSCDNVACCNPSHLWRGTYLDNIRDMDCKRRRRPAAGELSGSAKLTEEDIAVIRTAGKRGVDLAKEYGVAKTTISAIRNYKTWRHIL